MFPHWQAWTLMVAAALNTALANVFIKESRIRDHAPGLAGMLFSPLFIVGLVFFGFSLLLSTKALETLPVSLAYPVQAGSAFLFLTAIAIMFLGEPVELGKLVGISVILIGIVITAR